LKWLLDPALAHVPMSIVGWIALFFYDMDWPVPKRGRRITSTVNMRDWRNPACFPRFGTVTRCGFPMCEGMRRGYSTFRPADSGRLLLGKQGIPARRSPRQLISWSYPIIEGVQPPPAAAAWISIAFARAGQIPGRHIGGNGLGRCRVARTHNPLPLLSWVSDVRSIERSRRSSSPIVAGFVAFSQFLSYSVAWKCKG